MKLAEFHLPKRLRQTVAQVARVTCPAEVSRFGLVDTIVDGVELQLRAFPSGFRVAITAGLAALEAGSALAPRTLGRSFSHLTPDEAGRWYASFWHSPLGACRQLARAMKSLIAMAFYSSAPVKKQLEYHPDQWIADAARRRLERWGIEIRRHEDELVAPDPLLPSARLVRKVRRA
jgi:hypothetical protein